MTEWLRGPGGGLFGRLGRRAAAGSGPSGGLSSQRLGLGAFLGGTAVAATVLGLVLTPFYLGLATQILVFALLAMSLDVLIGYAGLPSLGQAAFFGAAAYTAGYLSLHWTADFWADAAGGVAVAVLIAVVFALLALRTRGAYFMMITLALAQVVYALAFALPSLTGAENGLAGVPRPDLGLSLVLAGGVPYFYFVAALFVALAAVVLTVVRSPFGYALQGLRDNEARMGALGFHAWSHRYVAFLFSAAVAGLAGVLFVFYNGFTGPSQLSVVTSGEAFLMVLLGGAATVYGSLLGAAVVVLVTNLLRGVPGGVDLILGAVLIGVVLLAPRGLLPMVAAALRRA